MAVLKVLLIYLTRASVLCAVITSSYPIEQPRPSGTAGRTFDPLKERKGVKKKKVALRYETSLSTLERQAEAAACSRGSDWQHHMY